MEGGRVGNGLTIRRTKEAKLGDKEAARWGEEMACGSRGWSEA